MMRRLLIEPPMSVEQAERWATADERAAAAGFSPARRCEYLAWRALLRQQIGADAQIAYDGVGAPVLPGRNLHVSVAHCPGRIALCLSDAPCAVDIEPADRDLGRVTSRYLSSGEQALSADPLFSLIVWCAKEALYKYAKRQELDLLHDLRIMRADLEAGKLTGCITDGEPIELSVRRDEGFVAVYIL